MSLLDEIKKRAQSAVKTYTQQEDVQKRLNDYAASNKVSTYSDVKNTVKQAFQPVLNIVDNVRSKPAENWYKGDHPTRRETLARIYDISNEDASRGETLFNMYEAELSDPTSPFYNPYTQATTSKANKTTLSNTAKAQEEWARLSDELSYWATRSDRNYSDDEIISRIDWDNYKTLQKMDEGRKNGNPLALLDAVGYSEDAMYGVLWAARNPDAATGDAMMDAAQRELGRGNQPKSGDVSAYRDATSDYYSPYKAGATALDDLAYKYGMTGDFDEAWLNGAGRALLNADEASRKDYARIYDTVMATNEYRADVAALNKSITDKIEAGMPPDEIFNDSMFDAFPKAKELYESQRRGILKDTSGAVDFSLMEMYEAAEKAYADRMGRVTPEEYNAEVVNTLGSTDVASNSAKVVKPQTAEQLRASRSIFAPYATEMEKRVLQSIDPSYGEVKANVKNGVLNGSAGSSEAYKAAMTDADDFAAQNYLTNLAALRTLQAEKESLQQYQSFYDKWLPKLDADPVNTMSDPEYVAESEAIQDAMAVWDKYAGDATAIDAAIAEQQKLQQKILSKYADAELLNESGYAGSTMLPMLNFIDQFNGFEAGSYSTPTYEWETQLDSGADWVKVKAGMSQQMTTNAQYLIQLDTAIKQAELYGVPENYIEGMQNAKDMLIAENTAIQYGLVRDNADFSAKVKEFDETQEPFKRGLRNLFERPTREEIIKTTIIDPVQAVKAFGDDGADLLAGQMSESEKETYKYLYMTEGEERATAYYESLAPQLNARGYESVIEQAQVDGLGEGAGKTLASIFINAGSVFPLMSNAIASLNGEKLDPYSPTNWLTAYSGEVRASSKKAISDAFKDNPILDKVANFAYDAATTAADSTTAALIGGSKAGSLFLMGTSAAQSTLMDASARNAEGWQAWALAGASAAAETLTEFLPTGNLFEAFELGGTAAIKELGENIIKGIASDAPGEMVSEFLNGVTDDLIMQEMSNSNLRIQQLMAEYKIGYDEASAIVQHEAMTNILYAGLLSVGTTVGTSTSAFAGGKVMDSLKAKRNPAMARAAGVLSRASNGGSAEKAATISGVLEGMGADPDTADAVARTVVSENADAADAVRGILLHTEDEAVLDAIEIGTMVPESHTGQVMAEIQQNGATDENAAALVEAAKQDREDPAILDQLDGAVLEHAEGAASVNAMMGNTAAYEAVEKAEAEAKKNLDAAQGEYDKAKAYELKASADLGAADHQFNNNPADDKFKAAMLSAIETLNAAQEASVNAEQALNDAKAAYDDAYAEAERQRQNLVSAARSQAEQYVGQRAQEIQAKRVSNQTDKAETLYNAPDDVRAEAIAKQKIAFVDVSDKQSKLDAKDFYLLEKSTSKRAREHAETLMEKFGIFKRYRNENADIEFNISGDKSSEYLHIQSDRRNNYADFGIMLANLDELIAGAIPIEMHKDVYEGTSRADPTLEKTYVLLSAVKTSDGIIPVEFEVKEFKGDKENTLHVAVTLKKIEAVDLGADPSVDETNATTASSTENAMDPGAGLLTADQARTYSPTMSSSDISVAELVKKINPSDGDFLKYIPDSMLDETQKQAKAKALQKQQAKRARIVEKDNANKGNGKRSEIQRTQVPPQTARGRQNAAGAIVNPIRSARKLSDALGIGERIGTRKMNNMPRAVLGYYNNRARYLAVRSNQAGNITVNMHEIGHAIAQRLNMTGTPQMVANLPAMFAQNYAANELPGEAFAEFMWRYMTDDAQAEAFAGSGFIYQFEQALRRAGIADSVHTARDEMHAYVNATVNDRIGSMVVDRSRKERTPIREWFTKALSGLADSTAALEQIDSDIRNRSDGGFPTDKSLRDAALMRNTADRRAWNILTGNLTDSNWNIVGDSLAAVIDRSGMEGADFDLLNNYMLALHSIDREAQGLPVFDDNISFAERQNFISDVEHNHYNVAMAAEEIHAWWHNFMQLFMVDTGYLTQETLDRFEQMYPHYVPTNRVKKNGVRRNGEGGSTYTVRRATGSTEEIYNPMDTIVQNVNTIVKMVSQNNVGLVFDQLYQQYDGLGIYARNVTEDMRLSRVDTTTLHDEIENILTQAQTDQDAMEEVLDLIGNEQTQWRATGNVNLPNVMQVRLPDGTRRFYEFSDNEIFKAVSGLKEQHANGLLDWLGRITRSMSALTTGSNPLFSIRNFMRDFQKSVNYGSWATSYADGMAKWLRAAYEVWREGGEYEQYKALGGGGWTRIDANTKKGADEYRGELFRGYNTSNVGRTVKWAGKKVWNAITLSRLNEVVEQASRYAEYRFGQQDKTTEAGRQKAFLNAQEATVDFNRAGNSQIAHDLKMIVPFFNASVQGVYQTGREFLSESERGRLPARFAKTVLNTAIASALASGLMLKFMDDEDKEEFMWLSDDLKSDHIYLPNFLGGDAPLIRIPLAQDPLSRAVHGWVTNMMWNTEGMDEPAIELTAIASNILDGFNPISGTVWDPVLAMATNKNWYGSNIVPTRMQNWHPTTQYTEETADLFVEAGQRLNVSPLMLEYMFEQYTGFLGQIVIPAISKNEFTGEMQGVSAVIAEARKKMTSDPLLSNNITSAFYDSADMFEQIRAAASNEKEQYWLNRSLSEDEARAAVDEAEEMLKSGGVIASTKKLIADAYNRIDAVNANPDLSDHEKYIQTSEIRREMLENVLDANEAIGAYCEKYVNGENLLTRAIFAGNVSRASTTYEKLPDAFKADYDAGETYMTRSREVWLATGKDAALPKVNYSFSDDSVDYAVADDMKARFEDVYKTTYEQNVNAISNWGSLSDAEKLSKLKSAHTKAQNAAKKWYLSQIN